MPEGPGRMRRFRPLLNATDQSVYSVGEPAFGDHHDCAAHIDLNLLP